MTLPSYLPRVLTKFSDLAYHGDTLSLIPKFVATLTSQREFHTQPHPSQSPPHGRPLKFTLPSYLKSCATLLDLSHGKKIHACIVHLDLQSDTFVASSLINMYVKCGSLLDASNVFTRLPERDATLWNTMLSGYFQYKQCRKALHLISNMQLSGVRPDGHSLSILLAACSSGCLDLKTGKQAHAYMMRNSIYGDIFLETALIDMYAKCGEVMEAYKVFNLVASKEAVTWNAMLGGFWQNELWEQSLELFGFMKKDGIQLQCETLSSILTACAVGEAMHVGKGVHCCVIKMGFDLEPYVCTSLLVMYAKCESIDESRKVFDGVYSKGTELWNSMISACINNNCSHDALDVYKQMRLSDIMPDCLTIAHVLSACSRTGDHDLGTKTHGELIKRPEWSNMVVQSSMMTMYMKCGDTVAADTLFSSTKEWDVVVWSSMISGFCQNKNFNHALDLFYQFRSEELKIDSAIIASVASACGGAECQVLGFQIHGHAIKIGTGTDVFVGSSLIDMYAKFGLLNTAVSIFTAMPNKNLAVWNSMISGYSRNGLLDGAIDVFSQITPQGLIPDSISITSVLASVSSLAALEKGKMIHGYQLRNGIIRDHHVENALLDMYMKCGCLNYAENIFERTSFRNIVAWNTMISGFGSHGQSLKAIRLFETMQRSGVSPDEATFLSLISSCSHSGLIKEGMMLFECMRREYGINPQMQHYANIVDLLSRAGCVNEAYNLVRGTPIELEESVWLCLLSACRAHRCLSLGEVVADHILELKPEESGTYTQLLNFYSEMGLLDKAASARARMKEVGVKKNPGCSWIEVKEKVVVFFSGGSSSTLHNHIYDTLRSLRRLMRENDESSRDFFHWNLVH